MRTDFGLSLPVAPTTCLLLTSISLAILGEHDCVCLCIVLSFIARCIGFAVSLKTGNNLLPAFYTTKPTDS